MKHNTFKRTLAAGLAVLCVAAYEPIFGNTGLFDIYITASAETLTIGEGTSLWFQTQKFDGDITVKDGGQLTIVDNATLTLTGSFTAESNSKIILGAASKIIAKSIDFSSTNVTVPAGYAVKKTDTCIKTIPQWESGDCTVTLDTDDGTLTISGNGAMADYVPWKPAPWRENYNDSIKKIIVEDGVTHIGNYAFYAMQESILETVTFNGDIESIGEKSFQMCYTLKSVTFKGNVGSIGSDAFSSCSGMETLTFNGNVKEIGEDSFISCDNLSTVIFYGTVGTIYYDAFSGCNLKSLTFSDSVGSNEGDQGIMDAAFDNTDMTTVTLIPQADGTKFTFKCSDTYNDITSAKLVYAEGNTVLFDGDTKIEAGTAMSELTNKTLTWGYLDGIGALLIGYSLSLDGDIGVNFYMELADDVAASETAYMQFTIPAGSKTETKTVLVKDAIKKDMNGKTYHVFKCNVSAKDMASTIKAQIINGDKQGTEYKYSVKDYADYLLKHTADDATYAKAAPLVKKLLNYGAASQTYFGIAGTAVNAGLSEAERVIDNVAIPEEFMYNDKNTNLPTGVTLAGATLSLKSETTLSLYFTGLPDNTVFACEGKDNVESVKNGSYVVARIRGINAEELKNDFTVTIKDSDSLSVTYSPMTYCYNVVNSTATSNELKSVCRALYQYAQAANPNG